MTTIIGTRASPVAAIFALTQAAWSVHHAPEGEPDGTYDAFDAMYDVLVEHAAVLRPALPPEGWSLIYSFVAKFGAYIDLTEVARSAAGRQEVLRSQTRQDAEAAGQALAAWVGAERVTA